jgi:hypothetical protein
MGRDLGFAEQNLLVGHGIYLVRNTTDAATPRGVRFQSGIGRPLSRHGESQGVVGVSPTSGRGLATSVALQWPCLRNERKSSGV